MQVHGPEILDQIHALNRIADALELMAAMQWVALNRLGMPEDLDRCLENGWADLKAKGWCPSASEDDDNYDYD